MGDVDVRVGALVELVGLVTVTVLVLVSGGGTAIVVVTVLTLVVVVVLDVVVAAAAAITPQAIRLPDSPLSPLKFPGFW